MIKINIICVHNTLHVVYPVKALPEKISQLPPLSKVGGHGLSAQMPPLSVIIQSDLNTQT